MLEYAQAVHYAIIAIIGTFSPLAGGIGGGIASLATLEAINVQPRAKHEIMRASLIGLALIETSTLLALIVTLMLFVRAESTPITIIAEGGIALAIGITSFVAGIVSSFPVRKAVMSIARQPFFAQKILNLMLITQSIIQTPVILGLLVAIFINVQIDTLQSSNQSWSLLGVGLTIGLGSLGPTLGLANFGQVACNSLGIHRESYGKILPFVFLSEAIIETPLIFAFLISLIIMLVITPTASNDSLSIIRSISAAFCMGIGTLSPGINSSKIASQACQQIANNPQSYPTLSQTSIFGQGLIDAAAVYALLISFGIIFL